MFKQLIIITLLLAIRWHYAEAQINIWENTDVAKCVELTPYFAAGSNNPAIIVCPGGSYFWHDMIHEGEEVGRWLQANGITAFVLRYRTAYVPAFVTRFRYLFRGNRHPDAINDLRQTMRLVRQNAEQYGINLQQVGVMGFSAGGHLAMCAVEWLPQEEWPAFVAPIYPVVSMTHPCTHKRSRRGLLGDNSKNNKHLRDALSLEKHVPKDCPPVFLMNCKDDPIVHYHNAELLDSALTARQVPHLFIQYERGGHGFGASSTKGSEESRQWKDTFLAWFRKLTATVPAALTPSSTIGK